jgi:RND superfamily putative drug exporter
MSAFLRRLGVVVAKHRLAVIGAWLVILAGVVVLATSGGGQTIDNFTVPGTQSEQAATLLQHRIPAFGGAQTQVIFAAGNGSQINSSRDRKLVEETITKLRAVPQVSVVSDPFQTGLVSPNRSAAISQVQYTATQANVKTTSTDDLNSAVAVARAHGLDVQFSGTVYPGSRFKLSEVPEAIGLLIGLAILLITFGAVIAAGLPVITALIGVGVGLMAVIAVAASVQVTSTATALAIMLGLACGIDYSLFISTKHRSNLLAGASVEDSIAEALSSSGEAVVFAAITVILALCGLSVVGIPFLTVTGLCAAGGVLIAMLAALTLLPALLSLAGHGVLRFISPRARRSAQRSADHPHTTMGARWARLVTRRPRSLLLAGVVLMLVIAVPALSLRLGLPVGNSQPRSSTAHKAYALTSKNFGAGFNGPLLIAADLTHAHTPQAADQVVGDLQHEPDVVVAKAVLVHDSTGVIEVIPRTAPDATGTSNLVNTIRKQEPAIQRDTGVRMLVGGQTALNIDTSAKLSSALPIFMVVVVVLAFVLLSVAFRTVMVPLTAMLGFLLSAFAAFGAEVAVFQWGWASRLIGISPAETVCFVPIVLLAIIFGLSSDYEVFVVSRIRDEHNLERGDVRAVREGTGVSVRVVSAAATIMFFVFVSFLLAKNITIQAIGFGMAIGVLLDAFVVRLTLVPAVMTLLGSRFWRPTARAKQLAGAAHSQQQEAASD